MIKEMIKKELYVKVVIDESGLKTITTKVGFEENASSYLELVGIYENLKQIELAKLNNDKASIKLR